MVGVGRSAWQTAEGGEEGGVRSMLSPFPTGLLEAGAAGVFDGVAEVLVRQEACLLLLPMALLEHLKNLALTVAGTVSCASKDNVYGHLKAY